MVPFFFCRYYSSHTSQKNIYFFNIFMSNNNTNSKGTIQIFFLRSNKNLLKKKMITVFWQAHHFFFNERYWNTARHWNALLFLKCKVIVFLLETLGTFSKDRSGPSSPFEPTILFWMSAACVWALSWCLSISPGCPNLISASSQNFPSPERKTE